LRALLHRLGTDVVQIACGDPHHASWEEGDGMPEAARAAGFHMVGTMLGFAGEDYTTPKTIERTGGFGNPATRAERLERLSWAVDRTRALGLADLMLHAGFMPEPRSPDRKPFLDTLGRVSGIAAARDVTVAFETGQESAKLLRLTLDELACPNLKVNFDPANMLLYDKGDPIEAVRLLGPEIRSVHMKDANRPTRTGQWGTEMPLGHGQVNIPRFLHALQSVGYDGPLCIEREWGDREQRLRDIEAGIRLVRDCLRQEA
jgi:sugar phosphate isomerase/epimerase